MNIKLLRKAPLPFLGQKRNWIKIIQQLFTQDLINKFNPNDYIFIDMFGGSGLISHNLKRLMPNAEVVYNDYDNFTRFLKPESLNIMQAIYNDLKEVLKDAPSVRETYKEVSAEINKKIIDVLSLYYEKYKDTDLIHAQAIAGWICFSGVLAENSSLLSIIKQKKYYNRLSKTFDVMPYEEYTKGLIVESLDFRELYKKYSTRNKKLFLILDPPYIATSSGHYRDWFVLTDFLDLMEICEKEKFIMFSSDKSEFLNFIDWNNKRFNNKYFGNVKLAGEIKTSIAGGVAKATMKDQLFTNI